MSEQPVIQVCMAALACLPRVVNWQPLIVGVRCRARLPPKETAVLDSNRDAGWQLAAALLSPRSIQEKDGHVSFVGRSLARPSAVEALQHPFVVQVMLHWLIVRRRHSLITRPQELNPSARTLWHVPFGWQGQICLLPGPPKPPHPPPPSLSRACCVPSSRPVRCRWRWRASLRRARCSCSSASPGDSLTWRPSWSTRHAAALPGLQHLPPPVSAPLPPH